MSLEIGKHFMKYRVVTYDLYFQSEANWSYRHLGNARWVAQISNILMN